MTDPVDNNNVVAPPPLGTFEIRAAFCVGIIALVAVFVGAILHWFPQYLCDLVVRVVIAVAGAGFTVFLPGALAGILPDGLLKGLRIAGPLGVFVLLLLLNPGAKLAQSADHQKCHDQVTSGSFDLAEDSCAAALSKDPDDSDAAHWLGVAQFNRGKYANAIGSWQRSVSLGGDKKGAYYNICLAYNKLGDYSSAYKSADQLVRISDGYPNYRDRAIYAKASMALTLWLNKKNCVNEDGSTADCFLSATNNFHSYIEGGGPSHVALANLACLYATRSETDARQPSDSTTSADYFSQSLASLKKHTDTLSSADAHDEHERFSEKFGKASTDQCGSAIAKSITSLGKLAIYDNLN